MDREDMESLAVVEKSELLGVVAMDKECTSGESSGSVDNKKCSRRYSTGKPISPKRNRKITPNYLRASTGSCHDLCKYGIKHGSNHQDDRPWRKKSGSASSGKKSCVVTVALPERRKSMVVKHTGIPAIKSRLSQDGGVSGAVSSPHATEIIKREITEPKKKSEVPLKQGPSSENGMLKKGKQPPSTMRQSSSNKAVDSDQSTKKAVKRMSYSPLTMSTPSNSQLLKARRSSSIAGLQPEKSKSSSSEQRGGSINTGTIKSSKIKANSPHSLQVTGGPDVRNQKRDVSNVKTKLSSSSRSARTVDERGRKSESLKTPASNRPSLGKTVNIKPKIACSLRAVSPVKEENRMVKTEVEKTSDENVPEKTLHVVEMQSTASLSKSTEGMNTSPPLSPGLPLSPGMSSSSDEEVKVLGVDPDSHESPVLTHQQGMVMSLSDHEEVAAEGQEELVKGHMIEDEEEPEAGEVEVKEERHEEENVDEEEHEQHHEEENVDEEEHKQQLEHAEVGGGAEEEEMETEMESDDDDDDDEEGEENMYESDETVHLSDVEKINCKPLKKGYILSDSGVPKNVKLKFRRGKVMDIQSETTTGPRRLRFRQRKTVDENQVSSKNEATRRNFSKRHDIKGDTNNNNNNNSTNKEEKIVLRHQDSQGRKDGQGLLLNNVIEETASKLAETRKSKVKALVGAFETVISLQDSKPSVQLMV